MVSPPVQSRSDVVTAILALRTDSAFVHCRVSVIALATSATDHAAAAFANECRIVARHSAPCACQRSARFEGLGCELRGTRGTGRQSIRRELSPAAHQNSHSDVQLDIVWTFGMRIGHKI